MKIFNKKNITITVGIFVIMILSLCVFLNSNKETAVTNGNVLSTKKIEWGIKRAENHEQPDLGSVNKSIIDEAGGIAMGGKDSKKVYLTFDEGYEAGYTPKILDVLKENNVPATFFITAHFVNTQPDLVKRMIDEGHIVRKPHCKS